ncbi:MAG: SH3 domain-containing protein, partial [Chloroflexi bacterium]|nr:SH3 domain-containing protein [Chloroflexota bacterium]
MKAKSFLTIMILLVYSWAASAQGYAIRVTYNTNLRAAPSLDGRYVTTAKAGSVLQVLDQSDRWLRISQDGRDLWMAGWVSHSRVESDATQMQTTAASTQGYAIRVTRNTYLRAANSLESGIVAKARAGAILQVAGEQGGWLQIDRNGRQLWMAGWVAHNRVEASVATQPQTTGIIDNCCFVDRQCGSEQQWTDGYWAFQNGQCAAPTRTQVSTQSVSTGASQIDNCCYAGWQCHTDEQWSSGYEAYQKDQCASPTQSSLLPAGMDASQVDNCCWVNRLCNSDLDWQRGHAAYKYYQCSTGIPIAIEGSPRFVREVRDAFNLLKEKVPRLYAYGI